MNCPYKVIIFFFKYFNDIRSHNLCIKVYKYVDI